MYYNFRNRINDESFENYPLESDVPQVSVWGGKVQSFSTFSNTILRTFQDGTVIIATHEDPIEASYILENHLNELQE